MQYKKYQKLKAMQTFKQKFSEMTREYRDGFRPQSISAGYNMSSIVKVGGGVR